MAEGENKEVPAAGTGLAGMTNTTVTQQQSHLGGVSRTIKDIDRHAAGFSDEHAAVMGALRSWQWSQRRQMSGMWGQIVRRRLRLWGLQVFVPMVYLVRLLIIWGLVIARICVVVALAILAGWIALRVGFAVLKALFEALFG